MQKTKGDTFDLRAEEDAARRLNVGKSINTNSSITGLNSRGKKTDLIGKTALKEKVDAIAKNHGVSIDPEASLYLLSTIESRIKSLLQSAISAQRHRTNSSHLHQPPISRKSGRAIWSNRINNDSNSVLELVNKLYREEEQDFRKSRMTRLAKEAELQKIRDRASSIQPDYYGDGGPSTPISKPPSSFSGSIGTPSGAGGPSTPMFGAIKESTPGSLKNKSKGSAFKTKMNPRDVSAEVQHKMANATAMRSVGMGKKYGWMTGNIPNISSPLASSSSSSGGGGGGGGMGGMGGLGGNKKRKVDKESKLKESNLPDQEKDKDKKSEPSTPNPTTPETPGGGERPNKRIKANITQPTRRLILVEKDTITGAGGTTTSGGGVGEKRIEDDKVLTIVDLVFALEHNGLGGNGIGNEDEILKKIWAGKGGPWGEDGWDGRK